jgi:hypothetical protein
MCCALLLQQRHPLSLGISATAGDAVQVYAAGHAGAREVGAVPYRLVVSFACTLDLELEGRCLCRFKTVVHTRTGLHSRIQPVDIDNRRLQ